MRKSDITPLSVHHKGQVHKHAGKGASEQTLPSRSALSTLTAGDPAARNMNDYAKASPITAPPLPGGSGMTVPSDTD